MEQFDKILSEHNNGKTVKEIADTLGMSYGFVYRIHRQNSLKPNKKNMPSHDKIIELAKTHPELSYHEIGNLLSCTRQNVSFTCLKHGVRRKEKKQS